MLLRASVVLLLLLTSTASGEGGALKLIRGVVSTREGNPVAGATIGIFDRAGVEIATSVTDNTGRFEIQTRANEGEYELVIANSKQLNDQRIALGRTDVDIRLTISGAPRSFPRQPQSTVSVRQLEIPEKARAQVSRAQENFNKMQFSAAIKELDSAIRLDRSCTEAWSMRALVKLAATDLPGAVEDATEATRIDPNNAAAYLALGTAQNSMKSFQVAESSLRRALELDPDSWQAQLELAKTWYGEKRFVLALRQLAVVGRDYPDVHLVRANIFMSLGRQQEGAEEFSAFLREVPGDSRGPQIRKIVAQVERTTGSSPLR